MKETSRGIPSLPLEVHHPRPALARGSIPSTRLSLLEFPPQLGTWPPPSAGSDLAAHPECSTQPARVPPYFCQLLGAGGIYADPSRIQPTWRRWEGLQKSAGQGGQRSLESSLQAVGFKQQNPREPLKDTRPVGRRLCLSVSQLYSHPTP